MRDTYSDISAQTYRIKPAAALLGITDTTLRGYAENSGVEIKRAEASRPGLPSPRVFTPETVFQMAQYRRTLGGIKLPAMTGSPVVLTVDVIKGGTGKTTTSAELAVHLQLMGLRCILIDLDVQANATQMFGYEPDITADEKDQFGVSDKAIVTDTIATVMRSFLDRQRGLPDRGSFSAIKMPFGEAGPHLIPADTYLSAMEHELSNAKGHRELLMRRLIDQSCSGNLPGLNLKYYDVIIFDCPPSVSFTATAALAAADIAVAPIRMDAFSVKGLNNLVAEIKSIQDEYSVSPDLVILPTHYSANISRIGRMQLQLAMYRDYTSPVSITASEEFPKSLDNYMPLSLQKPLLNATKEYRIFAEYVHSKILAVSEAKLAVSKRKEVA